MNLQAKNILFGTSSHSPRACLFIEKHAHFLRTRPTGNESCADLAIRIKGAMRTGYSLLIDEYVDAKLAEPVERTAPHI